MLLATLCVAACLFCTVRIAIAAPALWLVQSPVGKVYLFGTVHIVSKNLRWRSPELEAAISQSQDLYLEIADLNDMREGAATVFKAGIDRDHPLSTLISKADVEALDQQARMYGMPGEVMFEPMRPWLAYMMLSVLPAVHSASGPGDASGVDLQIRKEFSDAGKPIRGFETFDSQVVIFSDLPQAMQIALLESELRTSATMPQNARSNYDTLVDAWLSGDEDRLANFLRLDRMEKGPMYAPLIGDRNTAWANALAQRLKQPGTSFVAVGAAHLVGPNGVPALLQQMGFTVSRVPIADASPSPSLSPSTPAAAVAPSPTPSPTASPSPLPPAKFTAPAGWQEHKVTPRNSAFVIDDTWSDPKARGILLVGHLGVSTASIPDLDTLDVFVHQGLVAAAGTGTVTPSKHVKVCGGTQDALHTVITKGAMTEDLVMAMSDHVYLAQYVRTLGPQDPTAIKALYSLCTP